MGVNGDPKINRDGGKREQRGGREPTSNPEKHQPVMGDKSDRDLQRLLGEEPEMRCAKGAVDPSEQGGCSRESRKRNAVRSSPYFTRRVW